jgi:hypothetical protein
VYGAYLVERCGSSPHERMLSGAQMEKTAQQSPLSRERILCAAVNLADYDSIESASMCKIAHKPRVVPMALEHVATKTQRSTAWWTR